MRSPIHFLSAILLAAFLLFSPSGAAAAPGDLDSLDLNVADTNGFPGVYATAVQPDGKVIIAGRFTSVLGVARGSIARINADGMLDAGFDPNVSGEIHTLAVQADGGILLGGAFSSLRPNGAAMATLRGSIARVNADGSLDVGFDPNANSHVESIVVQADGRILLGGYFTTLQPNGAVSKTTRNRIARVNADGTLDASFNPNANSFVYNITTQPDGKILLGGYFTTLQPNGAGSATTRNRIARVNADGTLDASFDPNANGSVDCVAVQADGRILLAGGFRTLQPNGAMSPTTRNFIGRVNAEGTLDAGFAPSGHDNIYSMALQADGKILLGMNVRNRIERMKADGSLDTSFQSEPNSTVTSVALQADGEVLIGGYFTSFGPSAMPRTAFARLLNTPATQTLAALSLSRVHWNRGGSSPELTRATLDLSTDGGSSWTPLGSPARVGSSGRWELVGLALPGTGQLRARGYTQGGYQGGSSGIVEQVVAFTIDTETLPPTLTAPPANTLALNPMMVSFSLPETAMPGSVTLTFSGTTTTTLTLASGAHSFSFSPAAPTASPQIASGTAIPDGVYSVTLSYRDGAENPPATATRTGVVIDTTPPQISVPTATREVFEGTLADYTSLAVATDAHPIKLTQSPAIGSPTIEGLRTITLIATDAAGNASSATFDLRVIRIHTPHTIVGEIAPGAGTNGIPADARIASLGSPATDDDGNVAFLAKWTSGAKLKGTRPFLNNACIPIVNVDAYKRFTDPVVDGGTVACIATLHAGGSAVMRGSVLLAEVAKTGTVAPDTGGATFKKFKAVAIRSGSVAIFAQLKAPSASDLGLWIKDGAGPLKLALREGQTLGGKTVKTLVSFLPGKDSPGQGRGWLTNPGTGVVLALAFFTDKTQGIVVADANGAAAILTSSGATFASYSVPAANAGNSTAFLATLRVGTGGVTKANARGIFSGDDDAHFTTIARTGADFTALGDPVLSANGGIAFTATSSNAQTLHWPAALPARPKRHRRRRPTRLAVESIHLPRHHRPRPHLRRHARAEKRRRHRKNRQRRLGVRFERQPAPTLPHRRHHPRQKARAIYPAKSEHWERRSDTQFQHGRPRSLARHLHG